MDREKRARKIKSEMVLRKIVGAEVARSLGISQQVVSDVIYGKATSARVVQALIEAGVPAKLFNEDVA